jgi:hypothetical protein
MRSSMDVGWQTADYLSSTRRLGQNNPTHTAARRRGSTAPALGVLKVCSVYNASGKREKQYRAARGAGAGPTARAELAAGVHVAGGRGGGGGYWAPPPPPPPATDIYDPTTAIRRQTHRLRKHIPPFVV